MPTPQAYQALYDEHMKLRTAVARYLVHSPNGNNPDTRELWDLAGDFDTLPKPMEAWEK